jgi:hypothetical protein
MEPILVTAPATAIFAKRLAPPFTAMIEAGSTVIKRTLDAEEG